MTNEMTAKATIIKSALKYLVKMQIEEGSVGFAVDNDPDHDCCWDDILPWLEAQPCEDCISRESVRKILVEAKEYGSWDDSSQINRQDALDYVDMLPSVTPTSEAIKGAYDKGYEYGVKDWFDKRTKAQTCIEDYPTCTECEHYDKEKHYCPRFCQVIKDTLAEAQPSEDCRNCKKWNKCPCGKEGHENGTSIGYSIGECKDYEPCEDYVSREAVDKLSRDLVHVTRDKADFLCNFWEGLNALPSVQPKTEIENLKTEIEKPKSEINDLISREDVITALIDADWIKTTAQQAVIAEVLNKIPSVKLETGKWIMNSDYPDRLICDKCNAQFDVWHWESKEMHFCPNCGAEMSGGGEDAA